jgi:hypothetical protein
LGYSGTNFRRRWYGRLDFQPSANFRQSLPHGYFAGAYEFTGAFEIVIGEAGYIGLDNQVCRATPEVAHLVLGDSKGLSDYVE